VVFKELERRANLVFEPDDSNKPTYIIEVQAQYSGTVYDRLVMELLLYRQAHPERTVYGQVIFLNTGSGEPNWPWADWVGRGPLRKPVFLRNVLRKARKEHPDHPLLAVFLPWLASDRQLAQQAPTAWRRLEALTEPGAAVLLDVFMSWMLERYKGRTYEEILKMLNVFTSLEETRAYQELVNVGRQKEALALLTKQIHRRFGAVPRWASDRLSQADLAQLEHWAEAIFDARDLTDLLGPKPN
jgi:hypothetical protein